MSQELAQKDDMWSLESLRVSSPDEFIAIYDHFAPRIFRHASSRVRTREAAEDIASQVFLKAWEYLERSTEPIDNVRAFLYRIAHNLICDHYRKRKFETVDVESLPEQHREHHDPHAIHERLLERETIEEVESALAELEEDYRALIVWRYIDELSVEEIISISGKSSNAVYVTLHRALKKIRKILDERSNASHVGTV